MEPEKVDELIHTLGRARLDAKKMAAARTARKTAGDTSQSASRTGKRATAAPSPRVRSPYLRA